MKSILLGNKTNINKVFSRDIIKRLEQSAGLTTEVFTQEDLAVKDFHSTEFIFSTWGMPALRKETILHHLPRLKAVFYAAGSVQTFAANFLDCGVKVFSAAQANAIPVAEYVFSQIILANKGFYAISHLQSRGDTTSAKELFSQIKGNYNTNIGLIGAGAIGSRVARFLSNTSLKVMVCDPYLSREQSLALGVEQVDLNTLFKACHTVSNHMPDNAHTKSALKYEHFCSMTHGGVFINTGRGAQVDESGLIKALKERPDLTAVLDVTYPEPPAAGHEFYSLENVFLTPHIAGSLGNEPHRMAQYMADEFENVFLNQSTSTHEVTTQMLATMA